MVVNTWSSNTQEVGKGGSRVSEASLGYIGHSRPSRAIKMPRGYKNCLAFLKKQNRWRPLAPVVPLGTNPMLYCVWVLPAATSRRSSRNGAGVPHLQAPLKLSTRLLLLSHLGTGFPKGLLCSTRCPLLSTPSSGSTIR